jgi:hypothetical protein
VDVPWLVSDEGRRITAEVRAMDAITARRAFPHVRPDRLADALTQATHRPPDFPLQLVTHAGVQQASPAIIAERRAKRLAAAGVTRVIDAGCGVGLDSWAFARAGLEVTAYESDPTTAEVARSNLAEFGVLVLTEDVTRTELPDAALFVDPARRRPHKDATGRPLRIRDPEQWSPPWSWVLDQARRHTVVARIRPGQRDLPPAIEWHCTSLNRRLVDATVWFGSLAEVDRRASVRDTDWHELTGPPTPAATGPVGSYIVDTDPAIVRTGLVTNAAAGIDGRLLDEHLAFITTDVQPPHWVGRCMRVLEEAPLRRARAACRSHGLDRVTVWSRGFERPPAVGLPEGRDGIVVAARLGPQRRSVAWIGTPAP